MDLDYTLKKFLFCAFLFYFHLQAELITIETGNQFQELIESKKPLILKFSADYCPPCRFAKQPFEEVASEKEFQKIGFVEIDIQSSVGNTIAQKYKVLGVPTFVYIRNGGIVDTVVGLENTKTFKDDLRINTRKNLATAEQMADKQPEDAQPERIITIEIKKELITPELQPEERSEPVSKEAKGIFEQLCLSTHIFFIFIIDKIKELLRYIIDLIKGIFGGK